MIRDSPNDNKDCKGIRVFYLEGSDAQELNCRNQCSIMENCVAVAVGFGKWNKMCFGCSVPFADKEAFKAAQTIAFRKEIKWK